MLGLKTNIDFDKTIGKKKKTFTKICIYAERTKKKDGIRRTIIMIIDTNALIIIFSAVNSICDQYNY